MIMRMLGHSETDRNEVQERWFRQHGRPGTQIIAHVEHQLIIAGCKGITFKQWRIAPPICIGLDVFDQRANLSGEAIESYRHSPGGAPIGGIQNMCRQTALLAVTHG